MSLCVPVRALAVVLVLFAALASGCQDSSVKLDEHMSRGEAYLEEEQYPEAILEYKSALQIDPNHAPAHYGLAKAYLADKKPRQAYWELQETVRLDPANLDARIEYGQFLLFGKEEELEKAVTQADEVLAKDPVRAEALMLKGRALQALQRQDQARIAFEKAVEVAPDEAGPLLLLANFHRRQGDRETAEPLYHRLTEVDDGLGSYTALGGFLAADRERDAEAEEAYRTGLAKAEPDQKVAAYSILANFYWGRQRYDEAEATLLEASEANPGNLDLLYALARFYNARGQQERADEIIEEATRADPSDPRPFLVLSSYRGRQGDLEGALEAADAALEADPAHRPAKLRKAELLVDLGYRNQDPERIAQGRAITGAVLSADPSNPEALLVDAKIDLAEGERESAVASLRRALDGRPDWAQAHFLLGSALFLERDLNGARAELVRALEVDADLLEAKRILARVHAALGEDELVVELGEQVIERQPDSPSLRILVAQSLVRMRRPDEALSLLDGIPADQRDAEANYAHGRVLFLKGDLPGARKAYLAAHEQDPTRFEVLRALLDIDIRQDRLAESAERIQKAVDAKPDDARLVQLQGEVALYLGKPAEAERAFQRAIELNPNDLNAYANLARYLMVTGRPDEVLATYEAALERNPRAASLHLVVGSLYEIRGDVDRAIERYEAAVRLDPSLAVAKNNLAYLLAETGGDLERALDLAQEAKEQLPENPNAADTLGWVLYKKNVPTAAIGYLKEAERGLPQDNPQLGVVRHHLALAYEANGEPARAREVLERAIEDLEALQAQLGEGQPEPGWAVEVRAMLERLDEGTGTQEG